MIAKPNRRQPSLARRLFYSHLICSLLVVSAVAVFLYLVVRDSLNDELNTRMIESVKKTTAALSAGSGSAELASQQAGLVKIDSDAWQQKLAASLRNQPELQGIALMLRGDVLARVGNIALPQNAALTGIFDANSQRLYSHEWTDANGRTLARVIGAADMSGLIARLEHTRNLAMLGFIGAVLLSLAFSQWLMRQTRSLVKALVDRFTQIANGRFDVKLDELGDPDLNLLGQSFNTMAQRLNTSLSERERALSELKCARDRLEQSVKDRSSELDRINVLLRNEHEQRAQIEANLAEAAATDPLTKLLNRRAMLELISHVGQHLKKVHKRCAFVILDIDYFKKINDRYGHNQGDVVLCAIAEVIRLELRADEAAARWGGEEFLLLWPEQTLLVAQQRANRLRELLAAQIISGNIKITASFGVAEFNGDDAEAAINCADQCLYKAKAAGRNLVVIDSCNHPLIG